MTEDQQQDSLGRVLEIVRRFAGSSVTPDTPLLSTGIVDSLSIADLTDSLSSTFQVPLGMEDLGFDNADTPRQLAALVDARR